MHCNTLCKNCDFWALLSVAPNQVLANVVRSKAAGICRHWRCSRTATARNANAVPACQIHMNARRDSFIYGNHIDGWRWHSELEGEVEEKLQQLRSRVFEAKTSPNGVQMWKFTPMGAKRFERGRQACIFLGATVDKTLVEAMDRCATCLDQPHPPWLRTVGTIGTNVITLATTPTVATSTDRSCWGTIAAPSEAQAATLKRLGSLFDTKESVGSVEHQEEWYTAWGVSIEARTTSEGCTSSVRTYQRTPRGSAGKVRGPPDLLAIEQVEDLAASRGRLLVATLHGALSPAALQNEGIRHFENLLWEKLRAEGAMDTLEKWMTTKGKGDRSSPCWCNLCFEEIIARRTLCGEKRQSAETRTSVSQLCGKIPPSCGAPSSHTRAASPKCCWNLPGATLGGTSATTQLGTGASSRGATLEAGSNGRGAKVQTGKSWTSYRI